MLAGKDKVAGAKETHILCYLCEKLSPNISIAERKGRKKKDSKERKSFSRAQNPRDLDDAYLLSSEKSCRLLGAS